MTWAGQNSERILGADYDLSKGSVRKVHCLPWHKGHCDRFGFGRSGIFSSCVRLFFGFWRIDATTINGNAWNRLCGCRHFHLWMKLMRFSFGVSRPEGIHEGRSDCNAIRFSPNQETRTHIGNRQVGSIAFKMLVNYRLCRAASTSYGNGVLGTDVKAGMRMVADDHGLTRAKVERISDPATSYQN